MTREFVVERYWPGVSTAEAEAVAGREAALAEAMRDEGRSIRVLRSTLVEDDETLLSFVEAESRADVVELGRRAGAPADRIVTALEMLPGDRVPRARSDPEAAEVR